MKTELTIINQTGTHSCVIDKTPVEVGITIEYALKGTQDIRYATFKTSDGLVTIPSKLLHLSVIQIKSI